MFFVHSQKIVLYRLVFNNHLVNFLLNVAQWDPNDKVSLKRQLVPIELSVHFFGTFALKNLSFESALEERSIFIFQLLDQGDCILLLRKPSILLESFLDRVRIVGLELVQIVEHIRLNDVQKREKLF